MDSTEVVNIKSSANISKCGKYRYWLSRIWDANKPVGMFICINPSKATSIMCDVTMCNCSNLAVQWGWGGFYIVNLFAFMATEQLKMQSQPDPVGQLNNDAITYCSDKVSCIVLAWGNGYSQRSSEVMGLLGKKPLFCIDNNAGGGYLHPGRIKTEIYTQPIAIQQAHPSPIL